MKRRVVCLLFLLALLAPMSARADWNAHGLYVVGDTAFNAKVNAALDVVGYAGWLPYVRTRISTIQQWFGDGEELHVGRVFMQPDGTGLFAVRVDEGDVVWLALAIVHEAAHVSDYRIRHLLDAESEARADLVTQAFAECIGVRWFR